MSNFLNVNIESGTITREPIPAKYLPLGGRALTARILLDHVKPTCDPLGPHNKLIFANGLLAGTPVSSSGRLSISAKSPLTGGIKESNSGGMTALRMAQVSLRAIIVSGSPKDDRLKILLINESSATLEDAGELKGMGVYETTQKLLESYPDAAITCIGPAGELQLLSSGVASTDKDGIPSRYSGRGGLGAVMGSKNLKAVVIVGKGRPKPVQPGNFTAAVRKLNKEIKDSALAKAYSQYGTPAMVDQVNAINGLPIRNFSQGKDERSSFISGDFIHDKILERGGEGRITHSCMPGCLVGCSNVWADSDGRTIVSPIEYETIGLMGSNLDIWDVDSIARLNYQCNDIGVDTIETGAALGVAMEAGLLKFGDSEGALSALEEIRRGSVLGRLIGSGAATVGKVLGIRHIPAVKGQAMPAYDPRAVKGLGVTYATSAMGADHTAGPSARAPIDHHTPEGKVPLSRNLQKLLGIFDSTGLCLFTVGGVTVDKQIVVDVINSFFGWEYDLQWLDEMCIQMLEDEKIFNEHAGINKAHHRLPETFNETKLPGIDTAFDVPEEELLSIFDYRKED